MGRPPCCDKSSVKKGLWSAEEDAKILAHISTHGTGNWTSVPKKAGLKRCGKSCRLRWTNYLRPDLKHDSFSPEEEQMIVTLHAILGSRWSQIAAQLPGRTDNDVKNYWNTKLRKKLYEMGIDPVTHRPISQVLTDYTSIGLLKGGVGINGNTTKKYNLARFETPNTDRISYLNRDLRNAFMSKSAPTQTLQNEVTANYSTMMTVDVEPPAQNGILIDNPTWDLLTQLQAIQHVAEASNCINQETIQPHFFAESSSSSTTTSITTHQGYTPPNGPPSFPSQPQKTPPSSASSSSSSTSAASSSSSSSFNWSDFLIDDAFLPPPNEEESSSTQTLHCDGFFFPNPEFEYVGPEIENCNGMGEAETGASAQVHGCGMMGSEMGEIFGPSPPPAADDDSFVEKILDRDSKMLWEFSDLLDYP